jgi:hypothetical protein
MRALFIVPLAVACSKAPPEATEERAARDALVVEVPATASPVVADRGPYHLIVRRSAGDAREWRQKLAELVPAGEEAVAVRDSTGGFLFHTKSESRPVTDGLVAMWLATEDGEFDPVPAGHRTFVYIHELFSDREVWSGALAGRLTTWTALGLESRGVLWDVDKRAAIVVLSGTMEEIPDPILDAAAWTGSARSASVVAAPTIWAGSIP